MTDSRIPGRVVGHTALYGVAAAVAKALALVTVPYLTRALTPSGYGEADLATSTAALLTLVATFSGDIPTARAYGLAEEAGERLRSLASYVWATAAVSLVLVAILLPVALWIAEAGEASSDQMSLALLTLVLVPVSGVQASLAQTLRIQDRPTAFAAASSVDLLAQLGLAVGLVAAGSGPPGVVIGFIIGSLIGLCVAAVLAREPLLVRPDGRTALDCVLRGAQFLPYVTLFVVADWALRAIAASAFGSGAVAQLGVAIRVASLLSLLGAAFALAWGPIGLARARDSATARLFGRLLAAYGIVSVGIALALGAIGPELIGLIAGPGYEGAAAVLPGFALAYAIAGTEYVLVVAAGVAERGSRVALAATAGAGLQTGVALALVPALGIDVVAFVVVIGRAVSFGILMLAVRPFVSVPTARATMAVSATLVAFLALRFAVADAVAQWELLRWSFAALVSFAVGLAAFRQLRSRPEVAA